MLLKAFFGTGFVSNLAIMIYPCYSSLKAMETRDMTDDRHWMTYWLVFACYDVAEDMMLPTFIWTFGAYYYPIKLGFFAWLQVSGSVWFFQNVVTKLVKVAKQEAQRAAGATDASPTHAMQQHQG